MKGQREFEELVRLCNGNKFQAVKIISSKARILCDKYKPDLNESQAISWVLTGDKPEYLDKCRTKRKLRESFYSKESEILSLVDDVDVKQSVKESISLSSKGRSLIYQYKDNLNEYQKARVRILTNMIWYRN